MSFVSSFLSGVYRYFYPLDEEENRNKMTSSSFNLFLGPKAKNDLPAYVEDRYPDRSYRFSKGPPHFEQELEMEVVSDQFLVVKNDDGKPHASGYEPGIVFLMSSSNCLGVARIHRTVDPLKKALDEMHQETDKKIKVFIIDGKASDINLHEQACRFIELFNKAHKDAITISDDLFRAFDFQGMSSKPGVQLAGFDKNNNPVAVIEYR